MIKETCKGHNQHQFFILHSFNPEDLNNIKKGLMMETEDPNITFEKTIASEGNRKTQYTSCYSKF